MPKQRLSLFDDALRAHHGARWLIGVDEAGRGPLAGPVVAAAVLLGPELLPILDGVRDSKSLTAARRGALFESIRSASRGIGVGWALPGEIDRHNILQATLIAMRRAVYRVAAPPVSAQFDERERSLLVVVDGNQPIPELRHPQKPLVRADAYSLAVASASIVAKVVRDRWMERLDGRYPGYGFSVHKGYGTREHLAALGRLGPSPVHRFSFEPVAQAKLL